MTPEKKMIREFPSFYGLLHLRNILVVIFVFMIARPGPALCTPPTENTDKLIIFLQQTVSPVSEAFSNSLLPEIQSLSAQMDIPVSIVDVNKYAPAEVAITPLIVFQNHRGRSIYQGRFTTIDRIRNFIRTSRFVPQGAEPNKKENIPIWKNGRERIWAPLKITPVTGHPLKGHDHQAFEKQAVHAFCKGFSHFVLMNSVELRRADRGFYMDVYPYLSEGGTLFLSMAVFSQFHCKKPVFEYNKNPLAGPWEKRDQLFNQAGKIMEDAVTRLISDPHSGDGFDIVPDSIQKISWKDLGFALPKAPIKKETDIGVEKTLPRNWSLVSPEPDMPPMIQFRFPAPLDQYSGEAKHLAGRLILPEDIQKGQPQGYISVGTASITMGEPDLDKVLQGSVFLNTEKYPDARFDISSADGDRGSFGYGKLSTGSVQGTFTLKGKTIVLVLPIEIEPVLNEDMMPRLLVKGSFEINLTDFAIEGADGPEPFRHMLLFDLNLVMKPE